MADSQEHKKKQEVNRSRLRLKLHEIIYEADTPMGKLFDVSLMIFILMSVVAVLLESVASIDAQYGQWLYAAEIIFTIIFSIEYALRIYTVTKPLKYVFSFFGIVDLLSILPYYLGLIFTGTQALAVIRILRILRVFRVFKLARYMGAANVLSTALRNSRAKIIVFLAAVFAIVVIMGSLMYLIEGAENGFTSIPRSIYWAIVTITTVGYGDISPATALGQTFASILMIMGYGIIAVPTGIVSAEMTKTDPQKITTTACPECSLEGHAYDAEYCKYCGAHLHPERTSSS